jgi:hypothetical protein
MRWRIPIRAFSLGLALSCCLCQPLGVLAWDGNWIEAPSGDFLYDGNDSQGKSGVSPAPQTYYEAPPRRYDDVDPEELSDYFGKGRRPDYSPYALLRLTQNLHYGPDITLPAGYYLVKAGDAGDGSPKAHDPSGASGDKTLQKTGPVQPTGGPARGGSSIDPGAYPDTTGLLAIEEIADASAAMPERFPTSLKAAQSGDEVSLAGFLDGGSLEEISKDARQSSILDDKGPLLLAANAANDLPVGVPDNRPKKIHRLTGPFRKIIPPSATDPYAPSRHDEKIFHLPRVLIFKKLGRVVAVVPIHRVQRYIPKDNGKIPPHPLIWLDHEDHRPVMKLYDRHLLFSTDFQ